MKPIETHYNGHLFRSRLEARWAAFFDQIGWQWEYEPFDCDGYIPDFVIQGPRPFLVEVKPHVAISELEQHEQRIGRAVAAHWSHELLIVGGVVTPTSSDPYIATDYDAHVAGVVLAPLFDDNGDKSGFGATDTAAWTHCRQCRQIGWAEVYMSYANRPCGHYDGNLEVLSEAQHHALTISWGKAHEITRWAGR